MAKQQQRKVSYEDYEKYQNGLSKHLDLRGINSYIDVVNNSNGRAILKKYLNFV